MPQNKPPKPAPKSKAFMADSYRHRARRIFEECFLAEKPVSIKNVITAKDLEDTELKGRATVSAPEVLGTFCKEALFFNAGVDKMLETEMKRYQSYCDPEAYPTRESIRKAELAANPSARPRPGK